MKLRKMLKTGILLVCTFMMVVQTKQMVVAEKGGNDSHYTYTITLYTGKEGTFTDGSNEVKITDLEYGQVISLGDYLTDVNLNDSNKYYVKGIRESGKDNNTVSTPAFKVECDREYVVAYGIKGDMTKYVVNYQDENGNTLAASQTFYGVVGDKAVVAFRYVDGYRPQAYNLTKTLSQNESENVLTFTYQRIQTPSNTETSTTTNNTTNNNTNTNVSGDTTTNDQTNVDNSTTNDQAQEETNDSQENQTTEDIIDLDDDETPLNNGDKKKSSTNRPAGFMFTMIGLSCIAILALILLFVIIKKKDQTKREQKENENNNAM